MAEVQNEEDVKKLLAAETFLFQQGAIERVVGSMIEMLSTADGPRGPGSGYSIGAVVAGLTGGGAVAMAQAWVEADEAKVLQAFRDICRASEERLITEHRAQQERLQGGLDKGMPER